MTAFGAEFFTMNEVNRLPVIQAVIEKRLRRRDAASQLDLTERQVQRLMNRYRESGAVGLKHKRRGSRGNRQLVPGLAELELDLIRTRYTDFGPTLACEKLEELHDLRLGKETVRRIMLGQVIDLYEFDRRLRLIILG